MTERSLTDSERIAIFDENFEDIKERINAACKKAGRDPAEVKLLAATKTVPAAVINHAIEKGIDLIGENKVQELVSKEDEVIKTVHKHFIGHLQTNKVKDVVGRVEMIESVDSVKLAREISKVSVKKGIVTDILLEVNIGGEESKSGFSPDEVEEAVTTIAELPGVFIKGLMTIPPICEKNDELSAIFEKMKKLFIDIGSKKADNVNILYLSMGMSGDFEEAILHGADIVRIGTALFGKRNYNNV